MTKVSLLWWHVQGVIAKGLLKNIAKMLHTHTINGFTHTQTHKPPEDTHIGIY